MNGARSFMPYVLVTPARNEEGLIEKTIESVIRQTVLPAKWVIVDDGSTDATADRVRPYASRYPWLELIQRPRRRERSFAGKVHAFNAGYQEVTAIHHEIVGNLDADVSFESDYLAFLLGKFADDPRLGVAGTVFLSDGYSSERDSFEGHSHVAGPCQLFRRRCWEEIGGYVPHAAGGVDWIAVTAARMHGWRTESFRERSYVHHRHLGTAERNPVSAMFSYGEKDYYLGGHPLWELFRVAFRATKRPYVVGGLAIGLGYCWALLRRTERPVSADLVRFHRREQMAKLQAILRSILAGRRVDSFRVEAS